MRFVRKFPGECCAEVSRGGEAQPCDKTAVAVAIGDADSDNHWPVCVHHARGRQVMPLAELLASLTSERRLSASETRVRTGKGRYGRKTSSGSQHHSGAPA